MIVVHGVERYSGSGRPVCAALGTFDGLHRGHQVVVEALLDQARRAGGDAVVVTFDPHPVTVVRPPHGPHLLTTIEERIDLFRTTGIDALVVVHFDQRVRQMTAPEWLGLLRHHLRPSGVVASSTHVFGRGREGTSAYLAEWAAGCGIRADIVPPVRNGEVIISSSAIRDRLRAGDVRTAGAWLGRWYRLSGKVVTGDARGRRLGMPTANLMPPAEKIVPAQGVYAAYATVEGRTSKAAVSIGTRPTFGNGALLVEAHLIDEEIHLYGRTLELAFVDRLREEIRFSSVEALKTQMLADVERARALLEVDARFDAG